ncbi:hypothetical protein Tco_0123753 [Tanacetum coccineum]
MIRRSGRIKQIESHIISERKGKIDKGNALSNFEESHGRKLQKDHHYDTHRDQKIKSDHKRYEKRSYSINDKRDHGSHHTDRTISGVEDVHSGWKRTSWSFPRGKKNKDEEDDACDIKESSSESAYLVAGSVGDDILLWQPSPHQQQFSFHYPPGKAATPVISKVLESIPVYLLQNVKMIHKTKELEEHQAKRLVYVSLVYDTNDRVESPAYTKCEPEMRLKHSKLS